MKTNIQQLRQEVLNIRRATNYGTPNFADYAKRVGAPIKRVNYRDLIPWCDTLAFEKSTDRLVVTEQNLQFYPAKVRVFYANTNVEI